MPVEWAGGGEHSKDTSPLALFIRASDTPAMLSHAGEFADVMPADSGLNLFSARVTERGAALNVWDDPVPERVFSTSLGVGPAAFTTQLPLCNAKEQSGVQAVPHVPPGRPTGLALLVKGRPPVSLADRSHLLRLLQVMMSWPPGLAFSLQEACEASRVLDRSVSDAEPILADGTTTQQLQQVLSISLDGEVSQVANGSMEFDPAATQTLLEDVRLCGSGGEPAEAAAMLVDLGVLLETKSDEAVHQVLATGILPAPPVLL
ncbi:unnamed protein product [Symbiodinium sp. KB8]|nr:unnamed protein product [Symbiodinium sp. KB8]